MMWIGRNHGQAAAMSDERMSGSDSFTTASETYSDDESLQKRHKVSASLL